jgi:D-galactarolactone cycloisomerase
VKVESLHVYILKAPLAQPFFFSQPGEVTQRASAVVELRTDEGLTGFGEALCHGLQPPEIAASVISSTLAELVIGDDPFDVGVVFERAYNRVKDFGPKGATIAAISAIDIALWDLVGKATGKPVHKLLGGSFRSDVEPYATGFYRTRQGQYPRDAVEEAERHAEAGFTGMKVKIGHGIEDDVATVRAVRKAIGPTVKLMLDANHAYNRAVARRLIRDLEDENIFWLEEPISPEDMDGYLELKALGPRMMIACGENEWTRHGFWPWVKAGAVDILQPDIAASGGFTGLRQIADLVLAAGGLLNPHVWGTAITLAASLQFLAALPWSPLSRAAVEPLLEFDRSDHPFRQELIRERIEMHAGRVAIPTKPGLGIDVDTRVLEKFAAETMTKPS